MAQIANTHAKTPKQDPRVSVVLPDPTLVISGEYRAVHAFTASVREFGPPAASALPSLDRLLHPARGRCDSVELTLPRGSRNHVIRDSGLKDHICYGVWDPNSCVCGYLHPFG